MVANNICLPTEKKPLEKKIHEFYTTKSIKKLSVSVKRIIEKKVKLNPNMSMKDFCDHPHANENHEDIKGAIINGLSRAYPSEGAQHADAFMVEIDGEWDKLPKKSKEIKKGGKKELLRDSLEEEDWKREFPSQVVWGNSHKLTEDILKKLDIGSWHKDKNRLFTKIRQSLGKLSYGVSDKSIKAESIATAVHKDIGGMLDKDHRDVLKNYVVSSLKDMPKETE